MDVLNDGSAGQTVGGIAHTFYAVGNLGQALRIRGGFDTGDESQALGNVELDSVMLCVGIGVLGLPAALLRSISFGEFGSRSLN